MNFLTDEDTWLVRAYQRVRLARARMGRLLQRRHVKAADYLQSLTVPEIKAQIARCRDCECKALCDRALRAAAGRSRYSFCPNTASIDRFVMARS